MSLTQRLRVRRRRNRSLIARVRSEQLTYLSPDRLLVLVDSARRVQREGVQGDFIECGVALGGSAVILAEEMGPGRVLHAYDVFGLIPPPGPDDPPEVHERYAVISSGRSEGINGDRYYGYRDDLKEHVAHTLAAFGHPVGARVQLHPGLFEDTLHPPRPVALAHIDCDWHDPVDTCLRRIGPQLSPGGLMVLDDYCDYGGCRKAADQFVAENPEFSLVRFASNAAVRRLAVTAS